MKYTLYRPHKHIKGFFNTYKSLLHTFDNLQQSNYFFTSQLEHTFLHVKEFNSIIRETLLSRSDYQYNDNIHTIINELTGDCSTCVIDEYMITIESRSSENIFNEILLQHSSDFISLISS